jgi:hypothetical protein
MLPPADDPDRAQRLSNLTGALRARFERTEALADADAAVEALQAAVVGIPADSPARAWLLSNLGAMLGTRFERTQVPADADTAVEAAQVGVAAAPRPPRRSRIPGQ